MHIYEKNTVIELVKLEGQHYSVLLGGKVFIRDSSLPLEDNLAICFKELGKTDNLRITTTHFFRSIEYESYLDSRC